MCGLARVLVILSDSLGAQMTTGAPPVLNPMIRMGKLYGALSEDAQADRDRDHQDARDIALVVRALKQLHRSVDAPNSSALTNSLRVRGFLEQAWEKRRRRGVALSNKFAVGGLWGAEAYALAFTDGALRPRENWIGKLQLEHVVPARVIADVVEDLVEQEAEADRMVEVLYALHHHVVLSYPENGRLPRGFSKADTQRMRDHYTEACTLSDEDYDRLVWSRYPDDMVKGFVVPQ